MNSTKKKLLTNEYISLVERISNNQEYKNPENLTTPQKMLITMGLKVYADKNLNGQREKILKDYSEMYANFYIP